LLLNQAYLSAYVVSLRLVCQTPLSPEANHAPPSRRSRRFVLFSLFRCHRQNDTPVSSCEGIEIALASVTDEAEKMPLTDFCNRSTARAPKKPPDSHTIKHLAMPCMRVEDAVDACLLALSDVGHSPKGEGSPCRYRVTQVPAFSSEIPVLQTSPSDAPCRSSGLLTRG
jgi:hypothetical protein